MMNLASNVDQLLSMIFFSTFIESSADLAVTQPLSQGPLLVKNGGRRNPWPRLLKYSTNRGVFCHVTPDKMTFSEVVSSVWCPGLFSANGNRHLNKTQAFHHVCGTKC